MASSVTDLCNKALLKLGERRITDAGFATPTNERERVCSEHYEEIRDAELRANLWNFAITRKVLSPDAETPIGWGYGYTPPSDFLRFISLKETVDYTFEEGLIKTWTGTAVTLRYVRRVAVVAEFDPLFYEALGCKLAWDFGPRLSKKKSVIDDAARDYRLAMLRASQADAIENPTEDLPEDDWITCRA